MTATFANSCGQPLSDTLVHFAVATGPNAGLTGTGVTDRNGRAVFTYSSAHLGTDTLQAFVTNVAGRIDSNPVRVIWTVAFAAGGSFVIGDLENAPGSHVLWWGAQWWKVDRLSRGPAPASFKGFQSSDPAPACGQTWTTRPGNSPHPPASVAALMGVIVTDHVVKSGSTISGTPQWPALVSSLSLVPISASRAAASASTSASSAAGSSPAARAAFAR